MKNERFQNGNRGLLCSDRNQVSCIRRIVSKLALVLLLNPTPLEYRSREVNSRDTNEWFRTVIGVYYAAFGTQYLISICLQSIEPIFRLSINK